MTSLEAARVSSLPEDVYYIPDFITEAEEERLLQKVGVPVSLSVSVSCQPVLVVFERSP